MWMASLVRLRLRLGGIVRRIVYAAVPVFVGRAWARARVSVRGGKGGSGGGGRRGHEGVPKGRGKKVWVCRSWAMRASALREESGLHVSHVSAHVSSGRCNEPRRGF
jgi:hypothetical protein